MASHPIIFSGPSVPAIQDGRKTQTRRVIIEQPPPWWHMRWPPHEGEAIVGVHVNGESYKLKCPYTIGDTLWVREGLTYNPNPDASDAGLVQYHADGELYEPYKRWPWKEICRFLQPRFMPRWASRITLEVLDVRVERVQDISAADCAREGCPVFNTPDRYATADAACEWYEKLWDSLNVKRGFGWEVNPWVFVVVFKVLEDN